MRVAILPEVTSGWHGLDVEKVEAFLWPERFDKCPVCGEVFPARGNRRFCSKNCATRERKRKKRKGAMAE